MGVDCHKRTHTAVALDGATGVKLGECTVAARDRGHDELLLWAHKLSPERTFALEDCRHVSGRLERHLMSSGEQVVRVPTKLMGRTRRSSRSKRLFFRLPRNLRGPILAVLLRSRLDRALCLGGVLLLLVALFRPG